MSRKRGKGGQIGLTEAVLLSLFVIVGLLTYGYAAAYSKIISQDRRRELDEDMQVFSSKLNIVAAYYPPGKAYLENTGLRNVTIINALVYLNGSLIWNSGIKDLGTIDPGEISWIDFNCPGCSSSYEAHPILVVRYLPTSLFNPSSPVENVHKAWVDSSEITILRKSSIGACPISGNWTIIDIVDPKENWGSPSRYAGTVEFRMPYASRLDTVRVKVKVTSDNPPDSRVGEADLPSMSNQAHRITTPGSALNYPITIQFTILTPGWEALQREWYFGRSAHGYIDFAMLTWSQSNNMVYEVYVGAHFRTSGTYKLTAKLYDCNGALMSNGTYIYVNHHGTLWIQFSIRLNNPAYILDIRRVEVLVQE
ncbi:MAG: hypothetical protein DRN68_04900 [Thaumarchaeota archaeon]|nr:MAG: hypothetical protein DRN68_04900 [Nitrososphaerota archaeon]